MLTASTGNVVQDDALYGDDPAVIILIMKSEYAAPAPPLFLPLGKSRLPAYIDTAKPLQVTLATPGVQRSSYHLPDCSLPSHH